MIRVTIAITCDMESGSNGSKAGLLNRLVSTEMDGKKGYGDIMTAKVNFSICDVSAVSNTMKKENMFLSAKSRFIPYHWQQLLQALWIFHQISGISFLPTTHTRVILQYSNILPIHNDGFFHQLLL